MTDTTTQAQDGQSTMQEAAGQAKEQVGQAAGQAKSRARDMLGERSTQVGEQVSGHAGDLRSVAEQLRSQGNDAPARLADQAAERAQRFGGYLERADADTLLNDLEDAARRNPWAVALGGLALGFAASRFLKASSQQRFESRSNGDRAQLPGPSRERYGVGTQPGPPPASPATPAAPAAGLGTA
jgi:uncharacterized protein YjbJ (UPF0337 family)